MPVHFQTPIVAERAPGKITLFFHQKQSPPTLPLELNGHVSADTWASRVPQIIRLTARYNHPFIEAIWIVSYFLLSIVIPTTLHPVVFAAANAHNPPGTPQSFYAAHLVSFSLFVAVTLAFWAPLLAYKALGQQRANVLARRWVADDARGTRYSGYVPLWQIRLPGVVRNSTRVTINLPSYTQPSVYHPQAYLPSWIAGPTSPPLSSASSLDALPIYDGAGRPRDLVDEKAPAYSQGAYTYAGGGLDAKV